MTIVNTKKIRWYALNVVLFFIMLWFFMKCSEAQRNTTSGNGLGIFLKNLRIAVSSPLPAFDISDMAFGLLAAALTSLLTQVFSVALAKKRGSSVIINHSLITGIMLAVVLVLIIAASTILSYLKNREQPNTATRMPNATPILPPTPTSAPTPIPTPYDIRDDFLGTWMGTYHNSNGVNGIEMIVSKDGSRYSAETWIYPVENSSERQRSGRYRSGIRFADSLISFETVNSVWIDQPPGWGLAEIIFTINGDKLTGLSVDQSLRSLLHSYDMSRILMW